MFHKLLLESVHRHFSTSSKKLLKEGDKVTLVKRIFPRDIVVYADLVNDHNPVHLPGDDDDRPGIVHGTYLLGLVSGLIASTVPGPGTILTGLEVKFRSACPYPSTVEVTVEVGKVRKLTKTSFTITNKETSDIILTGSASCMLTSEQLRNKE